jgi:hypothetical protein
MQVVDTIKRHYFYALLDHLDTDPIDQFNEIIA